MAKKLYKEYRKMFGGKPWKKLTATQQGYIEIAVSHADGNEIEVNTSISLLECLGLID